MLEAITQFFPSKIERLKLAGLELTGADCDLRSVLFPMKGLRTLTVRCKNLSPLINWLDNINMYSKLKELVLDARANGEKFDIQDMTGMAATRATMFVKLKSIKIVSRDKFVRSCALKLEEYIPHAECGPRVALVSDANDDSDGVTIQLSEKSPPQPSVLGLRVVVMTVIRCHLCVISCVLYVSVFPAGPSMLLVASRVFETCPHNTNLLTVYECT